MVSLSVQRRNEKFKQALALHKKGDLKAAQEAYVGILSKHPDDIEALHHIGILNLQTGDLTLAIAFFDQAVVGFADLQLYMLHHKIVDRFYGDLVAHHTCVQRNIHRFNFRW